MRMVDLTEKPRLAAPKAPRIREPANALLLPVLVMAGIIVAQWKPGALPHELGHVVASWIIGRPAVITGWESMVYAGGGSLGSAFVGIMGPVGGALFWALVAWRLLAKKRNLYVVAFCLGSIPGGILAEAGGSDYGDVSLALGWSYSSAASLMIVLQLVIFWTIVVYAVVRIAKYYPLTARIGWPRLFTARGWSHLRRRVSGLDVELRRKGL